MNKNDCMYIFNIVYFYRFIENCDLIVYKYAEYGKQFAKENKLSIGKNDNII